MFKPASRFETCTKFLLKAFFIAVPLFMTFFNKTMAACATAGCGAWPATVANVDCPTWGGTAPDYYETSNSFGSYSNWCDTSTGSAKMGYLCVAKSYTNSCTSSGGYINAGTASTAAYCLCQDDLWTAYGTGYQKRITRTCNGLYACNQTTQYQCAAGYYGSSTNGTSGCTACPCSGTSSAGSTSVSSCTPNCATNYSCSPMPITASSTCVVNCTCSCSNNSVVCMRGGTCSCSGSTPNYATCTASSGSCGNPTSPATCSCVSGTCTGVCPSGSTSDTNGWYTYSGSAQPCT